FSEKDSSNTAMKEQQFSDSRCSCTNTVRLLRYIERDIKGGRKRYIERERERLTKAKPPLKSLRGGKDWDDGYRQVDVIFPLFDFH
ncbi:hypothetical protein ALC53_08616, partial [Atta colombica]